MLRRRPDHSRPGANTLSSRLAHKVLLVTTAAVAGAVIAAGPQDGEGAAPPAPLPADGKVRIRGVFIQGRAVDGRGDALSINNDIGSDMDATKDEGLVDYLVGKNSQNLIGHTNNKWPTQDQGWVGGAVLRTPRAGDISAAIRAVLALAPEGRRADADDIFILAYMGHGSKSSQDADGDEQQNDAKPCPSLPNAQCDEGIVNGPRRDGRDDLTDDALAALLAAAGIPGIKVLIFGSCFSGGLADGTKDLAGNNTTMIMMACRTNEKALGTNFSFAHLARQDRWHSLFLGSLLAGLEEDPSRLGDKVVRGVRFKECPAIRRRGRDQPVHSVHPAKADANWDCKVTLGEWFNYAKTLTEEKLGEAKARKVFPADATQVPQIKPDPLPAALADLPVFHYESAWLQLHLTREVKNPQGIDFCACTAGGTFTIMPVGPIVVDGDQGGLPGDATAAGVGAGENGDIIIGPPPDHAAATVDPGRIGCLASTGDIGFVNALLEPVTVVLRGAPPEFGGSLVVTLAGESSLTIDIRDFPPGRYVWGYSLDAGHTDFAASVLAVDPALQVDYFPRARGEVTLEVSGRPEAVPLAGQAMTVVDLDTLADPDWDGREEVQTEIVSMNLVGLAPVSLRGAAIMIPEPPKDPGRESTGRIEEGANNRPGVLELPPLVPPGTSLPGYSFFDVLLEVELPPGLPGPPGPPNAANEVDDLPAGPPRFHNVAPLRLEATIRRIPAAEGDAYTTREGTRVQLSDESGDPADAAVLSMKLVPSPRPCDVDLDGDVDGGDIRAVREALNSRPEEGDPRDVDGDGRVTGRDLAICMMEAMKRR